MEPKTFPTDWNGMLEKMEAALGTVLAQAEKCREIQEDGGEPESFGPAPGIDPGFRDGLRTRWEKVEELLNEVDQGLEEEETGLRALLEETAAVQVRLRGWTAGVPFERKAESEAESLPTGEQMFADGEPGDGEPA